MPNAKPVSKKKRFKKLNTREQVTEYELTTNGLRLLFVNIPGSPTVTTNIVYKVGSQHEGRGETGLAHMLEHMLFKPTHTKGLAWKALEEKGALLNATTWLDRTLYYFSLPSPYLSDMLAVEADRMRNVMLTNEEFLPERANVLSEYEMYNSQPESALDWAMVGTAFHQHGYKHDTIGYRPDIEAYTTDKLTHFYNRFYWPNNATLIVAGDVAETELLGLVYEHFSSIPRQTEDIHSVSPSEPRQEGSRRVELARNTPLRYLSVAFRAPAFSDPTWMALSVAFQHLTLGETSPLHRALVETNYATSVRASLYPTKDPYLATISVYVTDATPYETVETIIFDHLKTLARKPISARELTLLKTYLEAQEQLSRDGDFSIAAALGEYVATGSWERYFDETTALTRLTAADISSAVRTYCTRSQSIIGTLVKPDTL